MIKTRAEHEEIKAESRTKEQKMMSESQDWEWNRQH